MLNIIAEYVSLVLTVPTVMLAWLVLKEYGPRAMRGYKHLRDNSAETTNTDYLVMGIVVGFAGALFDNIWWGIAWGAELFNLPFRDWLFENGVFSNIPFRQSAGVVAALFHLWPVITKTEATIRWTHWIAIATIVTAVGLGAVVLVS